ncbi:hypothetical protein EBR04_06715 [bacterium]|nr:hypothetical protein [bacterium]
MNKFVAAVVVAAATGCTMCPDPYDYAGPVPDGSAPQNDFRARSNGILPIGAASKPWPPIVGQEADAAVARVSGEEAEATESDDPGTEPLVVPEVDLAPVEEEAASVEADPPSEVDTETEEPAEILPPPQPASEVPVGPVPRETPGWRPRSQQ